MVRDPARCGEATLAEGTRDVGPLMSTRMKMLGTGPCQRKVHRFISVRLFGSSYHAEIVGIVELALTR